MTLSGPAWIGLVDEFELVVLDVGQGGRACAADGGSDQRRLNGARRVNVFISLESSIVLDPPPRRHASSARSRRAEATGA